MNDVRSARVRRWVGAAVGFMVAFGGCIPLDEDDDDDNGGGGGGAAGDVSGTYSGTFNTEAGGRALDSYIFSQQGNNLSLQALCAGTDPRVMCSSLDGARGTINGGPDAGRLPFTLVNDQVTITGEFFRQEGMMSFSAQVLGSVPADTGELRGFRQEAPMTPVEEEEEEEEEVAEEEEVVVAP